MYHATPCILLNASPVKVSSMLSLDEGCQLLMGCIIHVGASIVADVPVLCVHTAKPEWGRDVPGGWLL